jgi:hypothetical protein
MSRENERLNNVRRLAYCLYQYEDDTHTIKQLAALLHYLPDQLQKDIADLETYTAEKVQTDREQMEGDY